MLVTSPSAFNMTSEELLTINGLRVIRGPSRSVDSCPEGTRAGPCLDPSGPLQNAAYSDLIMLGLPGALGVRSASRCSSRARCAGESAGRRLVRVASRRDCCRINTIGPSRHRSCCAGRRWQPTRWNIGAVVCDPMEHWGGYQPGSVRYRGGWGGPGGGLAGGVGARAGL